MEIGKWQLENIFFKYRYPLLIFFAGLILLTAGIFLVKSGIFSPAKVEILGPEKDTPSGELITVEIAGEAIKPGVYKLPTGSRVEDLLIASGGFSADADRNWTDKFLNRAAKLTDGQKVYIPKTEELAPQQDYQSSVRGAKTAGGDQTVSGNFSSDSQGLININNASLSQLDTLPGIGPVYGQNIIEHRPYSNTEELLTKGVLKASTYEKIKDLITVY